MMKSVYFKKFFSLGMIITCLVVFSSTADTKAKVQERDLGGTPTQKVESNSSPSPETQMQPHQVESPSEQKTSQDENVFVRGFKATSRGVKKVGLTIGNGFKKVGSAVRGVFVKKGSEKATQEPSDTHFDAHPKEANNPPAEKDVPPHDLDSVGNDV